MKPHVRIARGSDKQLVDWLLSLNTKNRTIKSRHISYLRNEIRNGNWRLTSQGIGVTVADVLADGQHRLRAIVEEGYPDVEFILVTGLPVDAQNFTDLNARRNASDLLRLAFDIKLAGRFASSITIWLRVKNGQWGHKFSPAELIEGYQQIGDALDFVYHHGKAQSLSAPVVAAIAETYKNTQSDRLGTFIGQLISGEMLKVGDPALTLRNFLHSSKRIGSGGTLQKERYYKTLYACNAFLEGREITRVYGIEN